MQLMCDCTRSHVKNGRFLAAVMRWPIVTWPTLRARQLQQQRQRHADVLAVGQDHVVLVALRGTPATPGAAPCRRIARGAASIGDSRNVRAIDASSRPALRPGRGSPCAALERRGAAASSARDDQETRGVGMLSRAPRTGAGTSSARLRKRIQRRLDRQDLAHAVDVGDEARHLHRPGGSRLNLRVGFRQSSDPARQVDDARAGAAADVDRRDGPSSVARAHQRIHHLADPDEVEHLLAAVDLQILRQLRACCSQTGMTRPLSRGPYTLASAG